MPPLKPTPFAGVPEKPPSACGPRPYPALKLFIIFATVLAVCFARPLLSLITYAAKTELYSYILLIPFISAYLIKTTRVPLPAAPVPEKRWALLSALAGVALFAGYRVALARGWSPARPDYLAVLTLSFLFFLLAGAFFFFGNQYLRSLAFPVAFAFFSVPLPQAARDTIESILQHGSAYVAGAMLRLSGMPVFQQDMRLRLPGFFLEVAPECSGIHSTLVLFITSLLAGYLFFNSNWRRLALALAVIPLAYLRNGFRIFTIAQLCVRISPDMINSPIHRHGGPIFFALSLIPLLLWLVFLRKGEVQY